MKQMALSLEFTQSILLGSSSSTLAVPGWPKGCDEEGPSALGTLVSGQLEGRMRGTLPRLGLLQG